MADATAIITTVEGVVISLISDVLPYISSSTTIGYILTLLQTYLPYVEQGAIALVQPIKNIIASLIANGAVTPDQVTALQSLDQQVDAAYDAAWAAYNAANPVPVAP